VSSELLRETATWRRLEWHVAELGGFHLREAFESDPTRGVRLAAEAAGVYLDYSKNLVTDDTLQLLRRLASDRGLESRLRGLFRGGRDTDEEELDRIVAFALRARAGELVGATAEGVRAVVVVGDDVGPQLAYEALRDRADPQIAVRFVPSIDPVDLARATAGLDLRGALLVVSTTHTSRETLALTAAARDRLWAALGPGAEHHFAAVSDEPDGTAVALGIPREQVFTLGAGERLSSRSAAGLTTAIACGDQAARDLLHGFRAMDEHFTRAPLGANLPAIAGLLAVWYRSFLEARTAAVVPYPAPLRLLPAYVQQLSLPSLGPRPSRNGDAVETGTGPVVWGPTASAVRSTVLSFVHRGTALVPVDLVAVARSPEAAAREQHDLLAAGLIAQAQLLARGVTAEELEEAGVPEEEIPHRVLHGNHPTSVLLLRELSPATLGALLALYEHSVFTQAAIWDLDAFDRPVPARVEELAAKVASELSPGWKHELLHDSSTNALIERYRRLRDGGT
jgi:glucose-6-phosphate isomerase